MPANPSDFDLNPRPYRRFDPPFAVGTTRQVLFDDFLLAMATVDKWDQLAYNTCFSLGRVHKHETPIMTDKAPWESGYAWLTLLREGGRYRMWYNSYHADRRGLGVSYAESQDGLSWRKPSQGHIEIAGSAGNNVVFEGGYGGTTPELGNVFRDPNAHPGEEYKMVYADWIDSELFEARPPGVEYNGALRGASSPDGIHWKRYTKNFSNHYPDSQNTATWDPTLGKYVIYHRTGSSFAGQDAGSLRVVPQNRGRAVGRMESYDFFRDWSASEVALRPDLEDGLNTDIYNSAYSRHPDNVNAHYLFPSFYRHYEGTFEVQVCTSRDNITWNRPCRDTFIPLGEPGAFDCFIISVAPGFIAIDDETWALYYRSGDGPHGGSHPISLDYAPESRICRVTFKRDRVVGIEGNRDGGRFATRPLAFDGGRLVVNAEPTGPDPELKVQLLAADSRDPLPGYGFDDCQPIRDDDVQSPVVWRVSHAIGSDVPPAAVRLHFKARSMRVYAFQFLDR